MGHFKVQTIEMQQVGRFDQTGVDLIGGKRPGSATMPEDGPFAVIINGEPAWYDGRFRADDPAGQVIERE